MVDKIGVDHLGFTHIKICCHFIHLGATIAMYLKHIKTYTIMLQYYWSRNIFIYYMLKQVKESSEGASKAISYKDTYTLFVIP